MVSARGIVPVFYGAIQPGAGEKKNVAGMVPVRTPASQIHPLCQPEEVWSWMLLQVLRNAE